MIDFRYHLVSLVAIFLALATGVVLGAGPLNARVDQQLAPAASTSAGATAALRGQVAELRQAQAFEARFAAGVTPTLVAGRLRGRAVTLVTLPGAAPAVVASARTTLAEAGAAVGPTVGFTAKLLDPANKQLVDALSTQLGSALSKQGLPAAAGTYDRVGAILARALVVTTAGGEPMDKLATNVVAAFRTAKLVSPGSDLTRRGSLVLMLSGSQAGTDATSQARAAIALSLVRALDAASAGVVVAGPPAAAGTGGTVSAVRGDRSASAGVSTVDAASLPGGMVSVVYALAQQASGGSGQYGAVGQTSGALPGLSSTGRQ
jgi:copper transport outer membrane protein MctB